VQWTCKEFGKSEMIHGRENWRGGQMNIWSISMWKVYYEYSCMHVKFFDIPINASLKWKLLVNGVYGWVSL
jgi:hypothetical protein